MSRDRKRKGLRQAQGFFSKTGERDWNIYLWQPLLGQRRDVKQRR